MPDTMNAAYVTEPGPATTVRYGELPVPRPAPGEMLVRVAVTAVNPVDTFARSGAWRTPLPSPFVIGRDLVGTVATAAHGYAAGDSVWCNSLGHAGRQGAAAGYAAVALFRHARLRAGETVYVAGGGGNVGAALVPRAIDRRPLAQAAQAHLDVEQGRAHGRRIVLVPE